MQHVRGPGTCRMQQPLFVASAPNAATPSRKKLDAHTKTLVNLYLLSMKKLIMYSIHGRANLRIFIHQE